MSRVRDTIVVGASAGGVRALRELLGSLPSDFPAALLVVQHRLPGSDYLLPVLHGASVLPVVSVDARRHIELGCVYLAPPDQHLIVDVDHVMPGRGARENRSRPSINVLFRTAAASRASRVVGVQLTGMLDDGVAGLAAIKRCGGLAVVQEPVDAEFPAMPTHALEAIEADHVVPLATLPALLTRLAGQPAPSAAVPEEVLIEARFSGAQGSTAGTLDELGERVSLGCPACGGPLWKVGEGGAAVYRCHVGHALSARALLESQADEVEHSLWAAVRALSERARTLSRLAEGAEARNPSVAEGFRKRATEAQTQSEQARQFLLSLRMTRPDEQPEIGRS